LSSLVRLSRWRDLFALGAIALTVFIYLAPAIVHGPSFGPSDFGQWASSVTRDLHAGPLHNTLDGDIITQGIPWNTLNWQLVHAGHFPLWNSLSGNGMPAFLNFESGALALPSLLGYLVPLSYSFLVVVAVKLLIAGGGTYLCCRLLVSSRLAATFGAITFMLSGPVTGWLGWSISGVFVWVGFIVSGVILAYRERDRVRGVVLLAVAVAGAIYGGFPEGYALLGAGVVCLLVVTAVSSWAQGRAVSLGGGVRIIGGVAAGCALAAPLWLPGLGTLRGASRAGEVTAAGLPLKDAALVVSQGFCGLPTRDTWFCGGISGTYYESAAYVGVLCVVLALVAVIVAWRRPIVMGLGVTAVVTAAIVYRAGPIDPVQATLKALGSGVITLDRMLAVLAFVLAVLAALGLDALLDRVSADRASKALVAATVVVGVVVVILWLSAGEPGLHGAAREARRTALYWPSILLLLCGVVVFVLRRRHPPGNSALRYLGPAVGAAFLIVQSVFLLSAGIGLNTFAPGIVPTTPATSELRSLVGAGMLGLDGGNTTCAGSRGLVCGFRIWTSWGYMPEMNLLYGVRELAVHDPIVPAAYLRGWPVPDAGQTINNTVDINFFAPSVNSVRLARLYGVTDVLAAPGMPPPAGMVRIATIRRMAVYRVPGSATFTLDGTAGPRIRQARAVSDNEYSVEMRSGPAATLTARVTDFSGWTATAGGRGLSIRRTPQDLMSIAVPAGTTDVVLSYEPRGLRDGLWLAGAAVLGLCIWFGVLRHRRRVLPEEA
jgi:hypothetical protein